MNATAINVASLGAARDDFETNAENWPPNVKAAHDKPSPTSAHLGSNYWPLIRPAARSRWL